MQPFVKEYISLGVQRPCLRQRSPLPPFCPCGLMRNLVFRGRLRCYDYANILLCMGIQLGHVHGNEDFCGRRVASFAVAAALSAPCGQVTPVSVTVCTRPHCLCLAQLGRKTVLLVFDGVGTKAAHSSVRLCSAHEGYDT